MSIPLVSSGSMGGYSRKFYQDTEAPSRLAAHGILPHALNVLRPITSAVDVGCGTGIWLEALQELGVSDVQGLDGPWVDPAMLVIPRERFSAVDFTQPFSPARRFDLAISLEVAEHLPAANAPAFVRILCAFSDAILFSAAIPGQGGWYHVNEQWPEYWAALFAAEGYGCRDVVRAHVWRDADIPFWYRQNTLLFLSAQRFGVPLEPPAQLSVVHPEMYARYRQKHSAHGFSAGVLARNIAAVAREPFKSRSWNFQLPAPVDLWEGGAAPRSTSPPDPNSR